MVVVIILAILASMIVPRVTGAGRREFELAQDRVSDLLMMYAQRDRLGHAPVGLRAERVDDATIRLELVLLEAADGDARRAEWRNDLFARPVVLGPPVDANGLLVLADGEPIDVRSQTLVHVPGEDRPSIEIVLTSLDGERTATVRLSAHSITPQLTGGRGQVVRSTYNLDSLGRSREVW